MELKPINRETLQNCNIEAKNAYYNSYVDSLVRDIYTKTLYDAKGTRNTFAYYPVNMLYYADGSSCIYDSNHFMVYTNDVFEKLKVLFPDCIITHRVLYRDTYGRMFDYGTTDPVYTTLYKQSCIIIDWA